MSNNFVADPRDVAKSGDVVRVKVLSVDIPRHRISLTMRLQDDADGGGRSPRGERSGGSRTTSADPGRARSSARQADNRGLAGRRGGPAPGPAAGDRRDGAEGDRRRGAAGDRRGAQGGGSGGSNDRRGGGAQGGAKRDPRNAQPAPANGAMAEALRRAGLVNDKGGQQDRRGNRP
jgi:uncharacterized protein